jgi:two-component system, LytTR family, sensor kinase
MKRLIILLLLLSCFRFSYAQELTAEQQQLAWNFIYENMLCRRDLPMVFHNDIKINLLGKVTHEDSVIVQDFVTEIQKYIPHFKIGLDKDPGNFIIWINSKEGNYNSKLKNWSEITLARLHLQIPDNYSIDQRKKFIYFNILREGVVFFHKIPLHAESGMPGCVYNVTSFDSVTFSPFDLFILEKIYSPDFSIQLARNISPELQQTAWNSIAAKFMGETKDPIIYRTDIAIKLEGKVSSADSVCMNELIDEIKLIIPNRKIFLTKEKANIVFNLLSSNTLDGTVAMTIGKSIQTKTIYLFFDPRILDLELINRTFYFHLMRSLVDFSPSQNGSPVIEGCVFDEKSPDFIKFHILDAFILGKLYSDDFQVQFKRQYIERSSYREYLVFTYHNELALFFQFLGFLFSVFLFTVLMIKGAFKDHKWNWVEFNKQGLFLILMVAFYTLCISLSDLKFDKTDFGSILSEVVSLFLVINLIYLAERMILKDRDLGGSKIIIIFLTTLIIPVLVSLLYSLRSYPLEDLGSVPRYYSLLPRILVASLARCLYVFLNDRYKSIINQKDVELAQMGEFQKQAELQSLRAKINPHFLYNALNSIASLATTDARKTEQMALALSDFFKYAINREQKQLNTLSEELNAIRTYLEIEKVRFGDRLSFEIDCPEDLLNIQIPQLLIQPLVENAIKHGLSQITENGLIRISVSKSENQLKIRVYDNGPAFPDGPLSGFGIQNTQERIALLYGEKATINWQNGAEKYVEISIPV